MDKTKMIAALVMTANELDVLGMGREADAVTRVAASLMSGKRLAEIPGYDPKSQLNEYKNYDNSDGGLPFENLEDFNQNPLHGASDAVADAFSDPMAGQPLGQGGYATVQDQAGQANERQGRIQEIVEQIKHLGNVVEELRESHDLESDEQADEAEEMIAELESELHDLARSAHIDGMDDGTGPDEDSFDENDPYGDADMGSEDLFQGQERVPYSDDLAGGKGARLFK